MWKQIEWRLLEKQLSKPGFWSVRLTPQVASSMLRLNTGNRRQRIGLIDYIRKQVETGEFQDDHPAPLIFSDAGRMIDGQHRAEAISGMDIEDQKCPFVRVETGAPDSMREYIDTGISRTLEDRVRMSEDDNENRLICELCNLTLMIGKSGVKMRPTPIEAREFFHAHQHAIRQVHEIRRRERRIGCVPIALAAMEYFERDEAKARLFYSDMFVSAGTVQQAQMLRDSLLRDKVSGGIAYRGGLYRRAVSCMKRHMQDLPVKAVTSANW